MGRSKRIRGRGVLVASAFGACLTNLPAQAQRSPSPSEDRVTRNPAEAAVTSYPAQAAGDGGTVGGFNLSRWAEDWRSMRDPKRRDDAIDRLKYLPLDGSGDIYLTLSGELRLRVNQTTNPDLRDQALQRQDINRIVGGADLHLGPHLRVYGELAHGGIAGVNIGVPVTTNRNDLIVLQSFVEGRAAVGGARCRRPCRSTDVHRWQQPADVAAGQQHDPVRAGRNESMGPRRAAACGRLRLPCDGVRRRGNG